MKRDFRLHAILALTIALAPWAALGASPEELGQAVVEVYVGAMKDTGELLADRPDAADVQDEFLANKERYVQALVPLGREIEALSPGDRKVVEAAVNSINSKMRYEPELKAVHMAYWEATQHYFGTDRAFYKELEAINILTQYAFFDLLRKQEPEEAQRLGI